ncbi:MAG: RagB/SusD family nutrient uptake outer membrane protein [Chitinophagaceae bacterium]
MTTKLKHTISICFCSMLVFGCQKKMEEKSDKSLLLANTLSSLQGVMDQGLMFSTLPYAGAISSDNFYFTDALYAAVLNEANKKSYLWEKDYQQIDDWKAAYKIILNTNVVLQALPALPESEKQDKERYNRIEGYALTTRALVFHELAQLFAPVYSPENAKSPLGIPLKTDASVEDITKRATLAETYEKITQDLKLAATLVPDIQTDSAYRTLASKAGCFGLLARVYLTMSDFDNALLYADRCLALYDKLLDFNSSAVKTTTSSNFTMFNREVIFHASSRSNTTASRQLVDTLLYRSYDNNDIRKAAYYGTNGTGSFRGSYALYYYTQFMGIATDEIYLIKAECMARKADITGSMAVLNQLLITRWKTGTFVPLSASTAEEALTIILRERRKELPFRNNLRWSDLRRLNLEKAYQTTLKRITNGQVYELPPTDLRYTFLIPDDVITSSGIAQNPR